MKRLPVNNLALGYTKSRTSPFPGKLLKTELLVGLPPLVGHFFLQSGLVGGV